MWLDFIVANNGTAHYDGFHWTAKIERVDDQGKVTYTSDSEREFGLFAKIKSGDLVPGRWSYLHAQVADAKHPNCHSRTSRFFPAAIQEERCDSEPMRMPNTCNCPAKAATRVWAATLPFGAGPQIAPELFPFPVKCAS